VTHQRAIRLLKSTTALLVVDRLTGSGSHALRWHFHLAPGVEVEPINGGELVLKTTAGRWRFRAEPALALEIADAWYSPSYGVRIACRSLDLRLSADVSAGSPFVFAVGPDAWMDSSDAARAIAALVTPETMNTGNHAS
jgi:hypothetical protein